MELMIGSVLLTAASFALCAFVLTNWLSVDWSTGVMAWTAVGVTLLFSLLSSTSDHTVRGSGAIGLALALIVASTALSIGVHELLPNPLTEATYSISAKNVFVFRHNVIAHVRLTDVGATLPRWVELELDGVVVQRAIPRPGQAVIRFRVRHNTVNEHACPQQVEIVASNGTYLDPPLTCRVANVVLTTSGRAALSRV
jgi:hypothetical protein